MTNAGVMSPESSQNSSDDEINSQRGRGRELANLAELQAAIRTIEQRRTRSPDGLGEETAKAQAIVNLNGARFHPSSRDGGLVSESSPRLPLSAEARKSPHARSHTDTAAFLDYSPRKENSSEQSRSESDADVEDDELRVKPAMVRKKSGELVRPALRPSSAKRRPSSMPGTPTYAKAVHFDSSLEHVRHFLQVDRPAAVSAGSSPVDSSFEDDAEFPFGHDEMGSLASPFEWEICLTNFPAATPERMSRPVRVESVYLSSDNKHLMGCVAASNLAFHKSVVARFTLDYWTTTSEVVADFNHDIRRKQISDGYDRFVFSIKLEDQANLEDKTMSFCVRYNVNGQEFWDNNNSINYQIDFTKKPKSPKGKNRSEGKGAPRLNPSQRGRQSSNFSARPRSMPASSNDFATTFPPYDFSSFPQPSAHVVGDSPIRFRKPKPADETQPDASGRRLALTGQAFGNRYDFGASLSAAIQASGNNTGDRGGYSREEIRSAPTKQSSRTQPHATTSAAEDATPASRSIIPKAQVPTDKPALVDLGNPGALTAEKPSLQSSSYHELLDKYCFVRSWANPDGKASVC